MRLKPQKIFFKKIGRKAVFDKYKSCFFLRAQYVFEVIILFSMLSRADMLSQRWRLIVRFHAHASQCVFETMGERSCLVRAKSSRARRSAKLRSTLSESRAGWTSVFQKHIGELPLCFLHNFCKYARVSNSYF